MSWVRLPGAENCVTSRDLSRAVESRLHRPALGAPAETDVAIEGYVEAVPEGGFHSVVTITDTHGKLVGKRELDGKGSDCREMDAPLALTIALMIDPDAAFSATAEPVRKPPPAPPSLPPPPVPRVKPPAFRLVASAGAMVGFGVLPGTAKGAWVGGALEPRRLFPFELEGRFWLDEKVTKDGISVAFTRTTFRVLGCPLDVGIGTFRLGACAGLDAGVLTAIGNNADTGIYDERRVILDANLRGRVDWFFVPRVSLRVSAALAVPFIRDSFTYKPADKLAFQLSPAGGDVGLGIAVYVP